MFQQDVKEHEIQEMEDLHRSRVKVAPKATASQQIVTRRRKFWERHPQERERMPVREEVPRFSWFMVSLS